MRPIGKRLFVKEDPVPTKIGRIHVPIQAKPQTALWPHTGVVFRAGTKCETVKDGDKVVFARLSPMGGYKEYLIMHEDDVLAVVEE